VITSSTTTTKETLMNTNPHARVHRRRAVHYAAAAVAAIAMLTATGCSGSVVHNYRTFQSALDRGASCSELFDQRSRFDDTATLAKIDRDLDRIGCTSPDARRDD
jgi:hypothetical protein